MPLGRRLCVGQVVDVNAAGGARGGEAGLEAPAVSRMQLKWGKRGNRECYVEFEGPGDGTTLLRYSS
jgi:hypothetical protein